MGFFESFRNLLNKAKGETPESDAFDEPTNVTDRTGSDFVNRANDDSRIDRFSSLLPYTGYDAENQIFVIESDKPGIPEGLGFVMELNLQLGGSDELMISVTDALSQVAKPGVGIQFHVFGSPDLRWYFDNLRETTIKGTEQMLTSDDDLAAMEGQLQLHRDTADRLRPNAAMLIEKGQRALEMLRDIEAHRSSDPDAPIEISDDAGNTLTADAVQYQITVELPQTVQQAERVKQQLTEAEYQIDKISAKIKQAHGRNTQRRILLKMMEKRNEHYQRLANEEVFDQLSWRARNVRAFMSGVIPCKEVDTVALREATQVRDSLRTAFRAFGMFAYDWDAVDLIIFTSQTLNMQQTLRNEMIEGAYDNGREIRAQIISPETMFAVDQDDIELEDGRSPEPVCIRALSPRTYPSQFQLNSMGGLLGSAMGGNTSYPCPYLITTGIAYGDFDSRKNVVMARAARAQQTANSEIAQYLSGVHEVNNDWKTMQKSFDDGKGDCRLYHQLLLFAPRSQIDKAEQAARAVWRMERFELAVDSMMQKQALLASMPMMNGPLMQADMRNSARVSTKTAWNAGNMIPIIGEYYGTPPRSREQRPRAVLSLFGRRGQAMTYDMFANPSGNYNGCIIGTSGSGKSVLLQEIIERSLANAGRCWVIDQGRSYENMVKMFGGQYLEFKASNQLCLNPFSMIDDFNEDMEMVKPVIAQMVSPSRPLDDYESSQLELHINSLWQDYLLEPTRIPTITDLANSLKNNCSMGGPNPEAQSSEAQLDWNARLGRMTLEERAKFCDPRIRDLGVQLFPFTQDGIYGKWFDGVANVQMKSNFIVLELEELNSKRDLRSVILMLLMYEITRQMMKGDRSTNSTVIIDEAWDLMSEGQTGQFIEAGYRKARKYGGQFLTATQGVDDYFKSPISIAAFMNADCMFLMRQKKESLAKLEESGRLVLDDWAKSMMKSVATNHGKYAEVFIKIGDLPPAIGRLMPDPFSLLTMSTAAEDFRAIRERMARDGCDTETAIESILAQRGTGATVALKNMGMGGARG